MKYEFCDVDARSRNDLIERIVEVMNENKSTDEFAKQISQAFRDAEFGWVEIERYYSDPDGDLLNMSRL